MMSRFVGVILFISVVVLGCVKQNQELKIPPIEASSNPSTANREIVVSNWEPIKNWSLKANGSSFYFTKSIDKSNNGAVLVFVRNLWTDDPTFTEMGEPDEPLMIPFSFLPFNKKPVYVERWNYKALDRQLNVELDVASSHESGLINQKAELQYIIIPQELLQQKGQTEEALHEMSYSEVMQYLGLTS